ncbi:hypothetical protein HUE87_11425 [Candidatus Sulfurimonas marisnigri]|uniref:Porin domain-containing protein n=1 Tax=Candidatus Sulfurimonas marisnigri TaxID=2740405 RepID=A0A7S7LZS4_9BACT|nr:hypothetical protein [Candidatus Sulfurimonas marisnigri]QOY54471.1 hypothetical protein HUE87_11425 [Candidatus Sulfurimonas marisnigri]
MKKTLVSLAAASLLVTSAVAADKGIDIVTTGQAVLYYETHSDNGTSGDLFGHTDAQSPGVPGAAGIPNSEIQFGVQLGLDADLGNNFTFGSEIQYKGTASLDKNTGTDRQGVTTRSANSTIADEIALSQMNITKKIGNTTVKVGRQQLPKSLSPFAYTEGWNVFKNSFDAVLVVNTDLPNTTLVASSVGESNAVAPFGTTAFSNLNVGSRVGSENSGLRYHGNIYLLTAQNKSLPNTTITASYYDLGNIRDIAGTTGFGSASILWGDVAIGGKDLPMGLKVGLQGGSISLDTNAGLDAVLGHAAKDTTAFGVKASIKPMDALTLTALYTSVNDGTVAITNAGTGVKSPLYSQMVYNQLNIAKDADTVVVKAAYSLGDMGTIIAQYGMTSAGKENLESINPDPVTGTECDYNEFDLMYKLKAGGVQYFAALIVRDWDQKSTTMASGGDHLLVTTGSDSDTRVRLWARYSF